MLGTVLVVSLILMLIGAPPTWPHSRNWGYGPTQLEVKFTISSNE
jgi:hypothetical protein